MIIFGKNVNEYCTELEEYINLEANNYAKAKTAKEGKEATDADVYTIVVEEKQHSAKQLCGDDDDLDKDNGTTWCASLTIEQKTLSFRRATCELLVKTTKEVKFYCY